VLLAGAAYIVYLKPKYEGEIVLKHPKGNYGLF
jgi:hypothetical protein